MSSSPVSGDVNTTASINTSLPYPIPPSIPLLPATTSSPHIPPPPSSLFSPLPPISTLSNPMNNSSANTTTTTDDDIGGELDDDYTTNNTGSQSSGSQNESPLIKRSPVIEGERRQPSEGDSESCDGFQPRLVLRVKTKRNTQATEFEKQDISKNDSYCWVCHEGGEVLCCDKCPRVFHLQCSGLEKPPEDDEEWICPVCKNISRKQKRSRPYGLKDLLLLAVSRMMFPGTEIFQQKVPDDIIEHYREYIFHPMHLGLIKEKAARNDFQSTREFLHETEWILHNCIIYNGGKHALTKIAKGIVKICKEDMREIELCPSCYGLTVKQPMDWFCIPCNPPHRVVLAKVRGYPLWPAKLISETSDKCDVRFFGQHDRSLVQRSCIQDLNGPPPTPTTKTAHWGIAMDELTKYRQNINQMVQQMASGKSAEKFISEKIDEAPKQPPKPKDISSFPPIPRKVNTKPVTSAASTARNQISGPLAQPQILPQNGYKEESETKKADLSSFTVSNHIPCSPQIVMVNPSFSESEDCTIHGNSASFPHSNDTSGSHSNPSSPGSEIGLKIDLEGSELEQKKSIKCLAPSMKRKKRSNNNSEVYYDASLGASNSSTLDVRMITPTAYRQPSTRPGDVLSLITDNLAEKRALELKNRGTPVGGGSQGNTSSIPEENDVTMQEAFSSVYPRDKLAIAVVDPDAKRTTKRKKKADSSPVKKSKRISNKAAENATPPPSNLYDSHNILITGSDSFETSGFLPSSTAVYDNVEDLQPLQYGEGLVGDTMRNVDASFGARLDGLAGKRDDMGYQYFSEKMMFSVKTVINEMLSIFESKGKMGAKQIKEQLHTAWPVPDSRSQLEALKKELRNEMRRSLEMVKANAEVEREQIVRVVRGQVEAEKELAILETKKKKWCSYCFQEAQYNCCWNANYCNEKCQQEHWPEHSAVCMQVQNQGQQQMPTSATTSRPPAALPPPSSADSHKIFSPANSESNSNIFSFTNTTEHIMSNDELQSSTNPSQTQPVSVPIPQPQHPHRFQEEMHSTSVASNYDQQQHKKVRNGHMMGIDNAVVITVPEKEMFTISDPDIEQHIVLIEQCPNTATALLSHTSSPIITQSVPPHHVIPAVSASPSPLSANTRPISPATPPQVSEHPPSSAMHMGNTFSWPYQQQPMAPPMSHDFTQNLPLLPQVPALTPTTQSSTFFRVF